MNVPANEATPVWDNGEGFGPRDTAGRLVPNHGGHIDGDHISGMTIAEVFPFIEDPAPSWEVFTPTSRPALLRYCGYLRPVHLDRYTANVEDAAFEFFAPLNYDPTRVTVVVLVTWTTFESPKDPAAVDNVDRFRYPGWRRPDGLVIANGASLTDPNNVARPDAALFDLIASPPTGYQVITGYIVPRTFPRSLIFQMQRLEQLAKAIDMMLAQPLGSPHQPPGAGPRLDAHLPLTKMVMGGSFGGLAAQLAVLRFPEIYHGASARAFSASMRRMAGEQWFWNYVSRRTGTRYDETSLTVQDTLEWASWLRQVGWDYFNASVFVRQRQGELHRPLQLLVADEDTVTCGVDWLPEITGQSSYVTRGIQGSPLQLAWSVVDRRCHGEGGVMITPIGNVATVNFSDADRDMVAVAHQSRLALPNPPPVSLNLPDDNSESVYDGLLARGITNPTPNDPLLHLDPNFGNGGRADGHGLTLGAEESMQVATVGGQTYVYAGDADGIVHRFRYDIPTERFVEEARSVSLGYGAYALAVGPLAGGTRVVVGTLRHVYQLDPLTLQVTAGPHLLSFEHERPLRMAIAEVHGESPGKEILFTTFHGHLLVLSGSLARLTDVGEPGIEDFVVHEGQSYEGLGSQGWPSTSSKVPITLLSHRGHLINITLNYQGANPTTPPAELHCWSDLIGIGWPYDLEAYEKDGQLRVAAAFKLKDEITPGTPDPVRAFDALTLQEIPGDAMPRNTQISFRNITGDANDGDLEYVRDGQGQILGAVIRGGNQIRYEPFTGTQGITQFLSGHPPSAGTLCVRLADIRGPDTDPQALDGIPEVICSTRPGHVTMIPLSFLQVADRWPESDVIGAESDYTGPARPDPTAIPPRHGGQNLSVAGSWGVLSHQTYVEEEQITLHDIYAAAQDGELFDVDPVTGAVQWIHDLRYRQEINPTVGAAYAESPTPVRDLQFIGFSVANVTAPPAAKLAKEGRGIWQPDRWWIRHAAWQNAVSAFTSPLWYDEIAAAPIPVESPPHMGLFRGFVALPGGGDLGGWTDGDAYDGVRDLHTWGGGPGVYANMLRGIYFTDTAVTDAWSSTVPTSLVNGAPNYGTVDGACKDLRNMVADAFGSAYSYQSLRIARDTVGRLVVASTAGGGIVVLRPAPGKTGTILWSSESAQPEPLDDGFGSMALAVSFDPDGNGPVDIFYGTLLHYPDLASSAPMPRSIRTAIRWLRWHQGSMTQMSLFLAPTVAPTVETRPYAPICGLAVGDLLPDPDYPGNELVATTTAGDLLVLDISGGSIAGTPIVRASVDGTLGAYNSILIEDLDPSAPGNELYVTGSQGLFKWIVP